MRKNILLLSFFIPVFVIICVVLYRGKHPVMGAQSGISPSGTAVIPGDVLRRSHNIWTNRDFITVAESDETFRALKTLAGSLPVSENARSNAVQTCVKIIKAYGRGDWDAFLPARIPSPDFAINPEATGAFEREAKHCNITNPPDITTGNVADIYHLVWNDLVGTNGLFTEISFITNSLSVVETSPGYLANIVAPSFTARTNENFFIISPRSILDYRTRLNVQPRQNIRALRFFFFGKEGDKCAFYMFVFVLSEPDEAWIPWRLSVGHTAAPLHSLSVF